MSQTQLTPQRIPVSDKDGRFTSEWYKSIEDIYQFSGLAKTNFPLYQDLIVPGTQMTPGPADFPVFDVFLGNTRAYKFDATAPQRLHFSVQLDHGYIDFTNLRPFVQWAPSSAAGGDVVWTIEHSWGAIDGDFPATSIVNLVDTASGTAFRHQFIDNASQIDGRGKRFSSVLNCTVARDAGNAGDTYVDGCFLLSCGFHFLNSAHGTVKVWPEETT